VTPRRKALAHFAAALYFSACLFAARADAEVPTYITAAAAWGMGVSLAMSAVWWGRGS
jgi:hypothetical protein